MADISKIKPLGSNTTYNIKDNSAIANITRSGTTFTATRRDGTTFTFNQQDNNTWNSLSTSQAGYVAKAPNDTNKFLRGDATWAKVTWDNIDGKPTNFSPSTHAHATSLDIDTGTSQITLAYGEKYKLTTGGTSIIFTMPSTDDTDTHWTTHLYLGNSAVGTGHVSSDITNGNVYLRLYDETAARENIKIIGTGATSVTGKDGIITINSTDTTYTFDGIYNASTNKAATVSTVIDKINTLDGNLNNTTPGVGKTLTAFSQTNGKISATFSNISITKSQISDFPNRAGSNSDGGAAISANKINQLTNVTSLSTFSDNNNFKAGLVYTAAGGGNTISDKPSGVDAFGALSFKTANGWQGQLLIGSNSHPGVYWRTASASSSTPLSEGWKKLINDDDLRLSDSRTPKSHSHGNITNDGTLQENGITIGDGDKILITDNSNSQKIVKASISFDGATTTKALTQKGTWETFLPLSGGTITGNINVVGKAVFNNTTTIDDAIINSLLVNGNSNFINNVNFIQIPTAPTATAGTNTTQIATTEFVTNAVAQGFVANDAMVFKGLIGSNQLITQLPTSGYNAGWTYRVANAGIFAGEYCEVGDLLIAIKDGPASGSSVINADWGKVEHNIDGAVFRGAGASNSSVGSSTQPVYINGSGIVTAITGAIANDITGNADTATEFSSNTTVKLTGDATGESAGSKKGWSVPVTLANSGVTAGSYGPSANIEPEYGATFDVPYITVDTKGRVTSASTKTVKIPASDEQDHRDEGYGKITPAGNTGTSAVIANTTQITAKSYNEGFTFKTGNKWLTIAGTESATAGKGILTIGHKAGLTAKSSYGSTVTTASADGGTIKVTDVQYDEAGHITASTDRTITLSQVKNTAGSTNSTAKLFLIGATTQENNPQTYSNNGIYISNNNKQIVIESTSSASIKIRKFNASNNTDVSTISMYIDYSNEQKGLYDSKNQKWIFANTSDGTNSFVSSHFKPVATETYNLGASDKYWNNGYIKNLFISNQANLPLNSSYTIAQNDVIEQNPIGLIQSPVPKYLWHDIWAFCRTGTPVFYTLSNTDGATWTQSTLQKGLFSQKDNIPNGQYPILTKDESDATKDIIGARWVWKTNVADFAWCMANWLVLGVTNSTDGASYTVTLEGSRSSSVTVDSESVTQNQGEAMNDTINRGWVVFHTSTSTRRSCFRWLYLNNIGSIGVKYFRLTITKNNPSERKELRLSSIRLLSSRPGNQGYGADFEIPYEWDENRNITVFNVNPKTTGTYDLGTSNNKWNNIYAMNSYLSGTTDSNYSNDSTAAFRVAGGASIAKKLSTKELQIDNNNNTKKVLLQYNDTLETLNFVFM